MTINISKAECASAQRESCSPFFQLPIEVQEMIFIATKITNWFDSNLANMCLVHPVWASRVPHAILERGEHRDLIVSSILFKAENNLAKIVRSSLVFSVAVKIRSLTLNGFDSFTDDQLNRVFDTFCNLESVTVGFSSKLTKEAIVKAVMKANRLKALVLRCPMSDEGLETLAKSLPGLEGVDLTLCREITNLGVANFFSECSLLSDLRCSGTISAKGLFNSLRSESYPRLTSLDLSQVKKFDNDLFDTIRLKFPNLDSLALPTNQKLTEYGINALLHCPIQYIKFSGSTHSDACLEPFIRRAVHLESLHLSNCPNLTDRTCETLAKHRPGLKRLTTSGEISREGITTLVKSCNKIEHLDLAESRVVVDASLRGDLKEKLPHLKEFFERGKQNSHLDLADLLHVFET